MVTSVLVVCQVVAAVCLASCVAGSDIVFTSSPSIIRQLVTDQLTLRCSLKESAPSVVIGKRHILSDVTSNTAPSDVSFIHSIIITKAGVDVASVADHLAAQVFDNTTGVQVSGQIPGRGAEKGYLEVTWKYPGAGQGGSYKCDIRGMDQSGHDHDFSQTLDVAETEVLLSDVVGYIHQLKLTNDVQAAAGLNTTNVHDLKVEINDLKTSNNDLKTEVNNLKTKLNTQVMFTAIRTSEVTVSSTQVLVFNKLLTSVGGGYDTSTGVFTCPVAGFYVFDLHVMGQRDKRAQVCITHNNNTCVTDALAESGYAWQSGSTSVILQLRHGDTVKVIGEIPTSDVIGGSPGYTSFSGQLVTGA